MLEEAMYKLTLINGALLILLGTVFYVIAGGAPVSILFPGIVGLFLLILSFMAKRETWRKHVMHISVIVVSIGLLGSIYGIVILFKIVFGKTVTHSLVGIEMLITFFICTLLLILFIRSCVIARQKTSTDRPQYQQLSQQA